MSDRIESELEGLAADFAPDAPQGLVAAARQEGVVLRSRRRAMRRRAFEGALAALMALTALSFTPPGRAATGWVAALAGIGEEPTVEQVGSVEGSARVLANGKLSNGTPFEVVVKRVNDESFKVGPPDAPRIPEMICFQVDWPTLQNRSGGGGCWESNRPGSSKLVVNSVLLARAPGAGQAAPALFMGFSDDPRVEGVEVVQSDGTAGQERTLASEFLTVDGPLLDRLGGTYPASIFIAPLDKAAVAAGNGREAQVTAIAYDAVGNEIGRRDAFPPLDCPIDPSTLLPVAKSDSPGLPRTHAVEKEFAKAYQRAIECGYRPAGGYQPAGGQSQPPKEHLKGRDRSTP